MTDALKDDLVDHPEAARARFEALARRCRVTTMPSGDGMATLTVETDTVSIALADRHLDLLAREARASGDHRPLEQLRADLAVDLGGRSRPTRRPEPGRPEGGPGRSST